MVAGRLAPVLRLAAVQEVMRRAGCAVPSCHVAQFFRVVPVAAQSVAVRIAVVQPEPVRHFVMVRLVVHAVALPCHVAPIACHVAPVAVRLEPLVPIAEAQLVPGSIRHGLPGIDGHPIFRVLRPRWQPVQHAAALPSAAQFVPEQPH